MKKSVKKRRNSLIKNFIFFGGPPLMKPSISIWAAACPWTIDLPYLGHMRNVFVNGKDVIDNIGSGGNSYVGKTAELSYPVSYALIKTIKLY